MRKGWEKKKHAPGEHRTKAVPRGRYKDFADGSVGGGAEGWRGGGMEGGMALLRSVESRDLALTPIKTSGSDRYQLDSREGGARSGSSLSGTFILGSDLVMSPAPEVPPPHPSFPPSSIPSTPHNISGTPGGAGSRSLSPLPHRGSAKAGSRGGLHSAALSHLQSLLMDDSVHSSANNSRASLRSSRTPSAGNVVSELKKQFFVDRRKE